MGKELEASIEFEVEHMLCHVINLAAKAGLKAVKASVPNLDSRLYEDEDDSDLQPWVDTGKSKYYKQAHYFDRIGSCLNRATQK